MPTKWTDYFPPELSNVPMPAGTSTDPHSVEWSEMWPGSGYTRLLHWALFETQQATASIEALQASDGSYNRGLVLYIDRDGELSAAEARQVAAMLIEAADALDALQ